MSEIVRLDIDDVALSARKGTLRLYGKADKVREVPIHPPLRAALTEWLRQRRDWRAAATSTALFPNQRGGRLSATSASNIIAAIAAEADPDGRTTAHVLRHTFATSLVRGGTDLVTVAELLGHARLETVRAYTRPTDEDKTRRLTIWSSTHS
ncbi:MAG: tyrosine-type recombinase/integrase [Frankiaceae bacterium]